MRVIASEVSHVPTVVTTPPSPANAGWPNAALNSNGHRECALADAASGGAKIAGVYYLLTFLAEEEVAQSAAASRSNEYARN